LKQYKLPDTQTVYNVLFTLAQFGDPPDGAAPIIDVGTSEFMEYFDQEIFSSFLQEGGSTCRFFEGTYGSGKTHILQLIEHLALENGYAVCHIDLKRDLSFERWDQITLHILENSYMKINGDIVKRFPDIIEQLGRYHSKKIDGFSKLSLHHPCLHRAIIYGLQRSNLNQEEWAVLRRFLLGEKVYVLDLKHAGFRGVKKCLNNRNAEQFLNTFLNSMYYITGKGTVLLLDETDQQWRSQRPVPLKVQVASNLIRRFIDDCSNGSLKGTLAVFAVLPAFIRDCIECYPALGQRLEVPTMTSDAWRWPVLHVNQVNVDLLMEEDEVMKRQAFLTHAIDKFEHLVEYCKGNTQHLREEFKEKGNEVLQNCLDDHFKRELIKTFSSLAVKRIDEYANN
jgi:hypothetical protein